MLLVNNLRLVLLILVCLQVNIAWSQEDPVSVTATEESSDGKAPYQYFDVNQFEQKTLYKISAFSEGTYTLSDIGILYMSVEKKLFASLSTEITWHTSYFQRHGLELGMRYYPNKRAQSKAKKDRMNNFTGNYISASYIRGFELGDNQTSHFIYQGVLFDRENTYGISFGRQEKVGKWGFFDVRFPVKYFSEIGSLQFGFNISAGIGYGPTSAPETDHQPNKHTVHEGNFFEGKNVITLENPYLSFGEYFKTGRFSLSGEFLIADYYSVVTNLVIGVTYDIPAPTATSPHGSDWDQRVLALSTGIRRYVGVRQRLSKGKPVQKFTGTYIGVHAHSLFLTSGVNVSEGAIVNEEFVRPITRFTPTISGHFGWQQRLGKLVFFDVNLGTGYYTYLDTFELTGHIRTGIFLRK